VRDVVGWNPGAMLGGMPGGEATHGFERDLRWLRTVAGTQRQPFGTLAHCLCSAW
jgi:hypothetical protein